MKKFFLLLSIISLKCFALTQSKPMVSNSPKNHKWEIKAETISLFNKSFYGELSYRVHPNVSMGFHGGGGQASDKTVEWLSDILQKNEELIIDKDVFRLGLHINLYAKANHQSSWFIGLAPTYERGYFQKINRNNVKVNETKKLVEKAGYIEIPVKDEDSDKNDKTKKPKTEKKWVEAKYQTIKELSLEDPEADQFGHHIKMPIRFGYQWALEDNGIISVSVETGLHQNLTQQKGRAFVNFNLMLGVAL